MMIKKYTDWEYRGNSKCPECNSIIPQYIRYEILGNGNYGEYEVTETCNCGYEN